MSTVCAIVEGDGEVEALPLLLRRLQGWLGPAEPMTFARPIRVRRSSFLNRPEEFSRHLLLAGKKCAGDGWVLVLLDADDDCPAQLGPSLQLRAQSVIPHVPVEVVLANREYEAWFIASAAAMQGHRGWQFTSADLAVDAELPRDAKGWLKQRRTPRAYDVVMDQPALTARMDLVQAHARSRSFRKLCKAWRSQCTPVQRQP